ncbi:helix-turn-helix domain-containing protein [Halomarina salina]|uniref:Helix-turn-helix domain-containing protein n=1 Tax=Halomarina salina TaxID=1872699 RepID=A0ABD5RKU5_9EURY|nr:helix-turn-helix domain-containing protein [Halomarina salina]
MSPGVHVQLAVSGVDACPASLASRSATVESVTTSRPSSADGDGVVGELTVTDGDAVEASTDLDGPVFSDGDRSVYRFTASGEDCPCGTVPDHGCPVRDLRADGGRLVVTFVADDAETVRSVVLDLQSCCETVRLQRLTRSADGDEPTLVVVDRTAFTDRQYEVLRTAHEMGYFDRPKTATSDEVAASLDITVPTFSEHLAVSQSKLLDQVLAT